MSRSLVFLRDAEATDAERLADLWADLVRRGAYNFNLIGGSDARVGFHYRA